MVPVQTLCFCRAAIMHHFIIADYIVNFLLGVRLHDIAVGTGTDCPLNAFDRVIRSDQHNMLSIPGRFECLHQFMAIAIR